MACFVDCRGAVRPQQTREQRGAEALDQHDATDNRWMQRGAWLVRYGLDQCIGFSCREAGYAELNHLLIRFIFLDQHLALGLVRDGALDMSIDGVIAPLMYFMLAIGVDIIPEQWNKADSPRDC
jgi:hypothetical protein